MTRDMNYSSMSDSVMTRWTYSSVSNDCDLVNKSNTSSVMGADDFETSSVMGTDDFECILRDWEPTISNPSSVAGN